MRICIVGKYPPIEGGVSAQTYWAARGLAERGHEVFVVTNAAEVEETFRIRLEPGDEEFLAPAFRNGGAVRVFRPEHYGRRMTHIPRSNPFVSKLAGLAVQVVRAFDCEVVVGSYYEPYGMAASLAASWTGTRLLLEHAGSDLDRLMRLPELAAVYKQILRSADGVITRPRLAWRFLGMGVRPEALVMGPPYGMPASFTPDAVPLGPDDIDRLASGLPEAARPGRAFDPQLPTIGMYGKPGPSKGTYDLIAALGMLRADGCDFNFLSMSGSGSMSHVGRAVNESGLDDRTWLLPFLPHWRVPSFIRACTAVCFLERDFPVTIHGPVVAREVLTCGTCLVLSGEIHAKQRNKEELVDGHSVLLVPDPKDRETLAKQLRAVVDDPANAAEIGARGHLTTTDFPGLDDYVDAWEELVTGGGQSGLGRSDGSVAERLDVALPWAATLLGEEFSKLAEAFANADGGALAASEVVDPALAARFCDFIVAGLTDGLRDVARYERARLWAMRDDDTEPSVQPVSNVLGGQEPTSAVMRGLYPYRSVPIRVERFDYDVTPVLCMTDGPEVLDAAALVRQPTVVGFARMPNLSPTELRLNDATLALLQRCTGGTPAGTLVAEIVAGLTASATADPAAMEEQALSILASLYAAGVIGFADTAVPAAPLV
ncbi:MAG TPA: glycosyltransferase [Streptosporangiaceae bacterium]|nr:glycosyltransferase [Streptosporangiaceae bacterium]